MLTIYRQLCNKYGIVRIRGLGDEELGQCHPQKQDTAGIKSALWAEQKAAQLIHESRVCVCVWEMLLARVCVCLWEILPASVCVCLSVAFCCCCCHFVHKSQAERESRCCLSCSRSRCRCWVFGCCGCCRRRRGVRVPPFGIFRNWGSLQQTQFVVDV